MTVVLVIGGQLPRPDLPITVGLDGGYVRNWDNKKKHFEVIAGKSVPDEKEAKYFGFVQTYDEKPKRRLFELLSSQGAQMNQQITFFSDGGDTVRELPHLLNPFSEHILDWFHLTMRITVLRQYFKGVAHVNSERGAQWQQALERAKWYLWHGNYSYALSALRSIEWDLFEVEETYSKYKKLERALTDFIGFIEKNLSGIINYGERWRNGETVSTAFVESTVNALVSKRFCKKQQMQWKKEGAHVLLQTRSATLNGELEDQFQKWCPGFRKQPSDITAMAA